MSEPEDYTFIPVGDGGTALAGLMRGEIVAYVGGVADRAILAYRGMPMRDITPDRFQTLFGNGYAVTREFLEENRDRWEARRVGKEWGSTCRYRWQPYH